MSDDHKDSIFSSVDSEVVKAVCHTGLSPSPTIVKVYTHSYQVIDHFVADMEVDKID